MSSTFAPLRSLRTPAFARLCISQVTSLLGTCSPGSGWHSWRLNSLEKNSSVILGAALTLRVTAFVIFSPLAGALADRLD